MKTYLLSFFCMLMLLGCDLSISDQEKHNHFLDHIKKTYGYTKNNINEDTLIRSRIYDSRVCVYGEKPKEFIKQTIELFYSLISTISQSEFHKQKVSFKGSFQECSNNTDIFIFIFSFLDDPIDVVAQKNKVIDRFRINMKKKEVKVYPNASGSFILLGDQNVFKTIVFIDQSLNGSLKEKKLKEKFINLVLIEELFQSFSIGFNSYVEGRLFSKAQEPKDKFKYKSQMSYLKNIEQDLLYYPYGLCRYDLTYLVSKYRYAQNVISFNAYKEIFTKYYDSTMVLVKQIEKNQLFERLIDFRCSNNNSGSNNKIPVWGSLK